MAPAADERRGAFRSVAVTVRGCRAVCAAIAAIVALLASRVSAQSPSLLNAFAADSTAQKDTAHAPVIAVSRFSFQPISEAETPSRRRLRARLSGPPWLLPSPAATGGGDLADWIQLLPGYDVDDAPGVGQSRFYTHWGIAPREGGWSVDGAPLHWQRLSIPQRAQFDPVIVPSFIFHQYNVSDAVILERDTLWEHPARSSYFYRQGDFADTYSEGRFRRVLGGRLGIDLDFTFFDSEGRYLSDNRDTRHLRAQLVAPLSSAVMWRYQFTQFRDKTRIVMPESPSPLSQLTPRRDDLLWQMDVDLYRPEPLGSAGGWRGGLQIQSGKQSLRDALHGFRNGSKDQRWTLHAQTELVGWQLDAETGYERLDVEETLHERWRGRITAGRTATIAEQWLGAASVSATEYDTDPLGVELQASIGPAAQTLWFIPTVRVERTRVMPTLYDRHRPATDSLTAVSGFSSIIVYGESGDPSLEPQWNNMVSAYWTLGDAKGGGRALVLEGRSAYIENYTAWQDISSTDDSIRYAPLGHDARTHGFGAALRSGSAAGFRMTLHYAAQYAEQTNGQRLAGYFPHKASAILNWHRDSLSWDVTTDANVVAVWWYGDRRIDPTLYESPHVFRIDLAGSATLHTFTFYYTVQNLFNFRYRTRAEYPMTGRTMRFGLDWRFLD
jgi:hypothetical protein